MAPRRSRCPVACTLDVLGDRWTLLVVRDLMRGKRRFAEFLESSERIPTNILADRLKRLQAPASSQSRRYSDHPPRVEYHADGEGRGSAPGPAGDGRVGDQARRRQGAAAPPAAIERPQ